MFITCPFCANLTKYIKVVENDMELYVLILSMWGKTAMGEWLYIGNQYVYNTPMPKEQCEKLIDKDNAWSIHLTNEYYSIKFDCMPESAEITKEEHENG